MEVHAKSEIYKSLVVPSETAPAVLYKGGRQSGVAGNLTRRVCAGGLWDMENAFSLNLAASGKVEHVGSWDCQQHSFRYKRIT
jgi:hypothetical protein